MNISTDGSTIFLPNENSYSFPFDIKTYIVKGELIFVLLSIPTRLRYNNNVFALSVTGRVIWQIQEIETAAEHFDNPIMDIAFDNEHSHLLCWSWDCFKYTVSPSTGQILTTEFTK